MTTPLRLLNFHVVVSLAASKGKRPTCQDVYALRDRFKQVGLIVLHNTGWPAIRERCFHPDFYLPNPPATDAERDVFRPVLIFYVECAVVADGDPIETRIERLHELLSDTDFSR